jgi:hypothetical protein
MCCLHTFFVAAKTSAIIEDWNRVLVLPAPDKLTIREFMRITIMDEDGYDIAVYRDYYDSFRKVKSLSYTIYDAAGKRVRRLGKGDAHDVMFNASYEVDDSRMLILDPEYRNYPYTVEIESEVAYDGFLAFPDWMPRFTDNLEVRKATLTLEHYHGFTFRAREFNGIGSPVESVEGDMKRIVWSVADLAAANAHLNYRSFAADQPKVHIAPVDFIYGKKRGSLKTWADFGDWFAALNEGRNTLTPETKRFLDNLRDVFGNDSRSIVNAVYKKMQSRTRYISIQLGIGGFQSIPSEVVERTGYGDCKALTNYMKAMLDYLGIPSNYILVYAGHDAPDIIGDIPSNQFNHVFLGVPLSADTLLYECTSQTSPPAFIGTFTDDRNVLWVARGASKVIRTPAYSPTNSLRSSSGTVVLDDKGNAVVKINIQQTGKYFDDVLAYQHLNADQVREYNYDKFAYKDFTIQSFNYQIPYPDRALLSLDFGIKVNNFSTVTGSRYLVSLNVLQPLASEITLDVQNKKSDIRRGFTLHDSIQFIVPPNFRIERLPENMTVSSDFGSVEMSVSTGNNNIIIIRRKAMIKKGIYMKESFDRFNDFMKKVKSLEQSKIVVESKT